MCRIKGLSRLFVLCVALVSISGSALANDLDDKIYHRVNSLEKQKDSELKVAVGDRAPDFTLPALSGEMVSLSDYIGKKNIVLSFVPAAWTPVCSQQWPGYNIAEDYFTANDAVLLGITVDNLPTLYAWTKTMGTVWFPVLSDFWPHGQTCQKYGVLRGDGVAERAIIVIDKKGVISYIDVHDIGEQPDLEIVIKELEKIS